MISRRLTFCTRVANAVLAVGGMASVLALLYLFYQYGLTGQRRLTSAAGIGWYFGVPAALAGVCFAALRLRPTHKVAAAVTTLALITVVFGTEVVLTGRGSDRASRLEKLDRVAPGGFVETRDADQVVADARRAGVNAVQFVGTPIPARASTSAAPAGAQLVPLGGFPYRPTVTCIDAGEWRTFESDEHGFHNPPGLWGRVDIAAVGNSWTHGFCVPSNENYVALVRRHYPATLNLGMAGHGPLRILAVTTEYLSWLQPRVVLWFYSEGSLGELEYETKHPVLMRYLEEGFTQNLRERKGEVEEVLNQYLALQLAVDRESRARREAYEPPSRVLTALKLTSLREALGLVYGADGQERGAPPDRERSLIELLRRIIDDVNNRVSSWGGTLVFVYLPARERYDGGNLGVAGRQRSHVLEMVRDRNIPLIDLHPAFAMRDDPLSLFRFRLHYHYNAAGHRLVADRVLRRIESEQWLRLAGINHSR